MWSSGVRLGPSAQLAPDLFGSTPGGPVQLLYDNPNRGSELRRIVGDGNQLAFVEQNIGVLGLGGWTLWYVPSPGTDAIEIDHGVMTALPDIALGGKWLVWMSAPGEDSQLLAMDLTTMTRRELLASPALETQYWHPAVDGDRLVYGTVEMSPDGRSDERHIYLLDLADSGEPERLDHSTSASEPAIHGDDVIWKESDPRLNFVVSGGIVHYDLRTGASEPLRMMPGPQPEIDGYPAGWMLPSIGNRYVAAWSDSSNGDRTMYLADFRTGDLLQILDLGPTDEAPHNVAVRPELSGDLLAYVFAPADGDLELRWIRIGAGP